MSEETLIAAATLARQSYSIACAQNNFGGPRGIWLECTACPESQVIVGSRGEEWEHVPSERAAEVFIRHGWAGEGPLLKKALCPKCAASNSARGLSDGQE